MSLTLAMNAAISGLSVAQAGLNTVANNIANVNTEGYTRKIFSPESRVLSGTGVGVQFGDLRNNVDRNLLEDMRENRSGYGLMQTTSTYFKRVQDVFGTTSSNNSIAHRLTGLHTDFETLAVEPDKVGQQMAAIQSAASAADQLARMSDVLQGLRLDADREIQRGVQEMNTLMGSISKLNDQIALSTATNRETEDMEDKRDVALNRLADLIDIKYFHNSNGSVTVFTSDGTTLIDSSPVNMSHAALTRVNPSHSYAGGDFNGIFAGVRDITSTIRSGKLKALIDMRDKTLPDQQAQLDELARNLAEEVNRVHNRGTSYPTFTSNIEGSRTFLNSAGQTLTLSNAETNVILFNPDGTEAFSARLTDPAGVNFTSGGTVDDLATALQTWLQAQDPQLANANVEVNADGKFEINLGSDGFGFAIREEANATPGSTPTDVTIGFDIDADGTDDQTHYGLSNFLGLNDFFKTEPNLSQWDSSFKSNGFSLNIAAATTLNFSDETDPTGIAGGTITVNPGDSLEDIRDAINSNAALSGRIEAEVVPEGNGKRLRIQQILGEQLAVTQLGGTDAIEALGLDVSSNAYSQKLGVAEHLKDDSSRISRGRPQYDSLTGTYKLAAGDNSVALELAGAMSSGVSFNAAGSLVSGSLTFSEYAASIISLNSQLTAGNETDLKFTSDFKSALELKHAEMSGVNMDEELAQLLVFQQSYAASARVVSTSAQLLEILTDLV